MNAKTYKHIGLVVLLCLAILAGCAPSSRDRGGHPERARFASTAASLANELYLAYTLPSQMLAEAQAAIEESVRAIFAASQAHGMTPTTAGTYQIDADGNGAYTPAPNDRLVVFEPPDTRTHLTVFRFNGDFQGNAVQFLSGNFYVSTLLSGSGKKDLMVILSDQGSEASLEISGGIEIGGLVYEGYLSRQESRHFSSLDSDQPGEKEITIQGIVSAGDLTIQVDEKLAVRSDAAETFTLRALNTRWMIGSDEYRFQDVTITSRIPHGALAAGEGAWSGSGQLLRNGLPAGEISVGNGSGQVEVWVDATGETFPLASWDIQ